MAETMEQKRAADAWKCSARCDREYVNLSKGLPALIMNSGLMQVMAFLQEKGGKPGQAHCGTLAGQMRRWLAQQFPERIGSDEFGAFMGSLMASEPSEFQAITAEAFAWLRWVRQMAPARLAER
jgi:CRISPR-associated protein Cmr5